MAEFIVLDADTSEELGSIEVEHSDRESLLEALASQDYIEDTRSYTVRHGPDGSFNVLDDGHRVLILEDAELQDDEMDFEDDESDDDFEDD